MNTSTLFVTQKKYFVSRLFNNEDQKCLSLKLYCKKTYCTCLLPTYFNTYY